MERGDQSCLSCKGTVMLTKAGMEMNSRSSSWTATPIIPPPREAAGARRSRSCEQVSKTGNRRARQRDTEGQWPEMNRGACFRADKRMAKTSIHALSAKDWGGGLLIGWGTQQGSEVTRAMMQMN